MKGLHPVGTGLKLNVHKTFRRHLRRSEDCPVSMGIFSKQESEFKGNTEIYFKNYSKKRLAFAFCNFIFAIKKPLIQDWSHSKALLFSKVG